MVRQKNHFPTKKHIFKDLYQFWHTVITVINNNKKKLFRSFPNTKTNKTTIKTIFKSNISKAVQFKACIHALSRNDKGNGEQQGLVQKLDNTSTATVYIDENDGIDTAYFTPDELLSEETRTTVSPTFSLTSLIRETTMIGIQDSESSIDNSDFIEECQENDNSGIGVDIELEVPCQCQSHLGRLFLNEIYPLTTEQFFAILFSPIPWYHHLQEIVNKTAHGRALNTVTGYVATSWIMEKPTVKTRAVTYTMALNNTLGPKSTSVTEKQTCHTFHGTGDGFSVIKEIQNAGIPYADNFIIQCTYCVTRAGSTHSRLLIHGAIVQKKSIWGIVKGLIEKSTYSGLKTHYTVLEEMLKLLCDGTTESKPATISESKSSDSINNNLLPNKLLNRYANVDISFLSAKIVGIGKF